MSRDHLHGVNMTDDDSTTPVGIMDGVFLHSVLTASVAVTGTHLAQSEYSLVSVIWNNLLATIGSQDGLDVI